MCSHTEQKCEAIANSIWTFEAYKQNARALVRSLTPIQAENICVYA